MKIEVIPHKSKNGLFSIKIIDETDKDKRIKSFVEIAEILGKPVKVYKGVKDK